jgi:aminoglycoside phosphotransferase family enzyme/predicted kinase
VGSVSRLPDVIRALLSPKAYDHGVDTSIRLIQTHISYVILADRYAYKIKKPLDLGFLDYSTLAKRRVMCDAEIRLNQRLCPEAYLGVVPITRTRGGDFQVGGDGEVVEYAVKMHRIPDHRMMPALLESASVGSNEVRAIARLLAVFHARAERSDRLAGFGRIDAIGANWEENFDQIAPGEGRAVTTAELDELRAYVNDALARLRPIFERRMAEGRIRDGHGDLRTDSIVIREDGSICVMDCIEFSDRIRYGDVASDIGFLAMDLDYRRYAALSDELISVYLVASRDETLPLVLPFYKCYRAVVRGKVETILHDEPEVPSDQRTAAGTRARAYFDLALQYARTRLRPSVVVMVGLTGSGKSYLANAIAGRAGFATVSSDAMREDVAPRAFSVESYGSGRYSAEARSAAYSAMRDRAARYLSDGHGVILDATHISRSERERAYALAHETNAPLVIVYVEADERLTREHLAARAGDPEAISEGRWDIYLAQRKAFEPLDDIPANARIVRINSGNALGDNVARVLEALG